MIAVRRVLVIGGSGHIGTSLVPRLVRAGHEVVNVSRGARTPYADAPEWADVRGVVADRDDEGFEDRVAELRPDVVVDLICFTLESATALVERLRGDVAHLPHCGSVWRYGPSRGVPISEAAGTGTAPVGEYGIQKDRIARMLMQETASGGLLTTRCTPGTSSGPAGTRSGRSGTSTLACGTPSPPVRPCGSPGSGRS